MKPCGGNATTEQEINDCVGWDSPLQSLHGIQTSIGLNDDALKKVPNAAAKAGGMHSNMLKWETKLSSTQPIVQLWLYNPLYHAFTSAETESDAVEQQLQCPKRLSPIYIVHVSTAKSLEHIQKAQKRGQRVYAETCPQYLLLNDTAYNGTFEATAKYVLSPPLRKQNDNDALWRAIDHGIVQTVGTDHCPFTQRQKEYGQDDFRKIPGGAGGVEHRLELLYTYGVIAQRITPSPIG